MTSYTIEYADGRVNDVHADYDAEAIVSACNRIGDDAVHGDWEPRGVSDGNETQRRMLIWATNDDADNDDGAKAVAQLIAVQS